MEDQKILQLLWDRAEQAIHALATRFGKRLHSIAMNILGDPDDAEESVNDTYFAVWNAIPPKRPEPLAPFVYRTGRNIALTRLRNATAQKRDSRYDLSLQELEACIGSSDLMAELTARELGKAIDAFLDTLSRTNRVLFVRRYWFGDSVKDIAASRHMTPNAVSVQLSRTRDKLKAYLTEEGFL